MVQWLGLCISTARGPGSIPGVGTKVPQAKKKERKKSIPNNRKWNWKGKMLFLLTILLTPNTWVFAHRAILTLTTQREHRAHSCGLRAQSHKTAFLFRWQLKAPGSHLYLPPSAYKSVVPMTPPPHPPPWLDNLLQWLTEFRETLYLELLVYYKWYNSGAAKAKRRTGQGTGKGHQASLPPLDTWSSQHLDGFANSGILQTPLLRGFMEIPLHRHNWLNHWPWVTECNSPAPLPFWGWGTGAENSNPVITCSVPPATSPQINPQPQQSAH